MGGLSLATTNGCLPKMPSVYVEVFFYLYVYIYICPRLHSLARTKRSPLHRIPIYRGAINWIYKLAIGYHDFLNWIFMRIQKNGILFVYFFSIIIFIYFYFYFWPKYLNIYQTWYFIDNPGFLNNCRKNEKNLIYMNNFEFTFYFFLLSNKHNL